MLYVFYLLAVVQIALGLYSLWDGYVWFGMVRGRLSSHAGFYAPSTALICPCKGVEPGLEENLTALTRFDYANYEIYFSLATSLDPALKIVERVKAASQRPVHIVIAGPPENCGEKVAVCLCTRVGILVVTAVRGHRDHERRRLRARRGRGG